MLVWPKDEATEYLKTGYASMQTEWENRHLGFQQFTCLTGIYTLLLGLLSSKSSDQLQLHRIRIIFNLSVKKGRNH